MTKQDEKFSLEQFKSDTSFAIGMLSCDVRHIERLLATARRKAPDQELSIRRELRPLAVELLYVVIGDNTVFENALKQTEEQADEDDE